MNFLDLTTDARLMRNGNETLLRESEYTDDKLINWYKDAALNDLQQDITEVLQLDYNDYDTLNTIATNYTDKLKNVLAFRQLFYIYWNIFDGVGTVAGEKFKYYDKQYNLAKSQFNQLRNKALTNISVMDVKL